jgi:hypothetical protein
MKKLLALGLLIGISLFISTETTFAQKKVVVVHKKGHHHPNKKVVVVHKSKYRPRTAVVYHPGWGPHKAYHRRWIFFPKYNLYWDNWRNVYFYRNGSVWAYSKTKPTIVVKVNLDKEKQYEMKESDDDNDVIYETNEAHKSEYKE